MKKILLILILLIITIGTYSQKNSGSISLTGMFTDASSGKQSMYGGTFSDNFKKGLIDFGFNTQYQLSYANNKKTQDDGSIIIQPRLVHNNWSVFTMVQWSKAFTRNLSNRWIYGTGGGFYVFKSPVISMTLSYGIIYVKSYYTNNINNENLRHSPRIQFSGNIQKLNYFAEGYYQPLISDLSSYNYNNKIQLTYPLTNVLSFTSTYTKSYESFSIISTNNNVSNFSFGLSYKY